MKINIIVAIAENYAIGKNNDLLWHLGDDLKRFKKLTSNNVVMMGQKTYESLPVRPLPKRTNIVISDDYDVRYNGCEMAYGITEAMEFAKYWSDDTEVFVMGGGSIYRQFFDMADKLYITKVHKSFEDADVFFPEIDEEKWELIFEEKHTKDENNEYDYTYLLYEKK